MSIISSEAERLYPPEAVDCHGAITIPVYTSDDLAEAYMDGAERQPTNEEIEAGAKAFYEALRAEYYDAMRLAVKAIQGKAAEE